VLTSRGEQVLASVGEELRKFPEKQIWVQGHTDSVPISNELFASNWELSAMRALTVVHYLEEVANVDPRRLAAVGFGEHRPLSRSKKYRNRRIEIVLFPREVRLINE
jgi:chemotaxis protein MotB